MLKLDQRLQNDTHTLGTLNTMRLLLHKNAEVPWFILVPETDAIELCDLSVEQHQALMTTANSLSRFIREYFNCDKINVAAIGNIVSQLHLHVIGRYKDDYAWPAVVWGVDSSETYTDDRISQISAALKAFFLDQLHS